MRKLLWLIALLMIPVTAMAAGFGGLLGSDEPLPDPGKVLGFDPTLFEEDIVIGEVVYTSFAYPMPGDMDGFIQDYSVLTDKAGYTITASTMPQANGKPGPFAYCVSAGAKKAYFVPNYLGCLLVMVDHRIDFAHMPTPVPTAPPTPPPTPTPERIIIPNNDGGGSYNYDSPSRTLEYQTVKVDCPSCHGGRCSVCNGSGTYRNYGVAVSCNPICTSCGGTGYIMQTQPVWTYD